MTRDVRPATAGDPGGSGTQTTCVDAFGLRVETDLRLPGTGPLTDSAPRHELLVTRAEAGELPSLLDEQWYLRNLQAYNGSPYVMLEGAGGDILFQYGRAALFHLSEDRTVLRCSVADEADPIWQRVLMDTILWAVSLLRGFELLHASAVSTPRGVVALVAGTGGGKSSLAAEYLRRGATLFADDVVALDDAAGAVVAFPGPPLMNLPRPLAPDQLGGADVLADFGDERWVLFERDNPSAQPLAAVVLIQRVAGAHAGCSRVDATSLTLLPHAVSLPHLQQRARHRFDVFGAVASTATVLALTADPLLPTSDLADLVEQQLRKE